jgi:hypothetical protein
MKGKYFTITGGALLAAYGVFFIINNTSVLPSVNKAAYDSSTLVLLIVLPSLIVLSGLLGIFTGITENNTLLSCSRKIGLKLAILALLLQGSVTVAAERLINPFYDKIISSFNLDSINSLFPVSWILILLLGVFIHVYMTGIEVMEDNEWDAYNITRSVTRVLFFLITIPLGLEIVKDSSGFSTYAHAACAIWAMVIFQSIRGRNLHGSAGLMVFYTIVNVGALFLYACIINWLSFIFRWFFNLNDFIPLVVIALGLLATARADTQYMSLSTVNVEGKTSTIPSRYDRKYGLNPNRIRCKTCGNYTNGDSVCMLCREKKEQEFVKSVADELKRHY